MTQEFAKLTARLEKLEGQNRRMKLAGLGVAGLLGAFGLTSMARTMCDTVSAERFVLRDSRGKTRLLMDAYGTEPNISFRNKAGKTVAQLGVGDDGEAYLVTFDGKGSKANHFRAAETGSECEKKKDGDGSIAMR